jgi:ketosteroid isomerase-like protein
VTAARAQGDTHGCDPVNAVEWAGQTEKATAGREPSVRTSPGNHRLTSDALRPAQAGLRLFWTHRSRSRLLFEPQEFIAQGDHVVVLISSEATVKRTGRSVEQRAAHVWTFRGAKVARFEGFSDTAAGVAAYS